MLCDFPGEPRILGCTSRDRGGRKIIKIIERGVLGQQKFADKAFDTDTFVREKLFNILVVKANIICSPCEYH